MTTQEKALKDKLQSQGVAKYEMLKQMSQFNQLTKQPNFIENEKSVLENFDLNSWIMIDHSYFSLKSNETNTFNQSNQSNQSQEIQEADGKVTSKLLYKVKEKWRGVGFEPNETWIWKCRHCGITNPANTDMCCICFIQIPVHGRWKVE